MDSFNTHRPRSMLLLFGALTTTTCLAQQGSADSDSAVLAEITVVGKGYGVEVGAKSTAPLREVPNSITVIDQERIQQQNLFTITDLANQTMGLVTTGQDSDLAQFTSRGFTIDNYLVDGVPNNGFTGEIPDLFLYDRVEVLRGPAGLFSGSGSPAGSINLVRKRPLAEPRITAMLGAGSWDNYRAEFDASTPLGENAGARAGVAYQDREQFFDVADQTRLLAFGVADYDVNDTLRLTLGAHHDRYRGATFSGLPGAAGPPDIAVALPDLRRSTYAAADWNSSDFDTTAVFAEARQTLGEDWVLRASGAYGETDTDLLTSYIVAFSGLSADNGFGSLLASQLTRDQDYLTLDFNAVGKFSLFGREHEVIAGVDFQSKTLREGFSDRYYIGEYDLYDWNYSAPQPDMPEYQITDTRIRQYGVYAQSRFRVTDPLSIVVGGRISWFENRTATAYLPDPASQIEDEENGRFTPYGGIVYDFARNWTAYLSYAENFLPQDEQPTATGQPLPSAIGEQIEAGVKASLFDARLLASLAFYRIEQTDRAVSDPLTFLYFPSGKVTSEGVDLELSGAIAPGWDLSGGYAYNDNEAENGKAFAPALPEHSVKLWTNYRITGGALADRLSFGGGVVWQSEVESFLFFGGAGASQSSYTLVNLRAAFDITTAWSLALNVNNVLDEEYYERVSGMEFGNFYGAPRNVFVSARMKF